MTTFAAQLVVSADTIHAIFSNKLAVQYLLCFSVSVHFSVKLVTCLFNPTPNIV